MHIKKSRVWFEEKWHEVNVTFSLKNSKFRAVLPERIRAIMGETSLSGASLKDLETQLERTAELAEAKGSKKGRKVIVFAFEYSGQRYDAKNKKIIDQHDHVTEHGGLAMQLHWHVAMERKQDRGRDQLYFKQSQRDKKAGNDIYTDHVRVWYTHKAILWTKEREQFFQNLDDSLVQAIVRLEKFTEMSPKKITEAIDAGQPALLGKGS